MQIDIINSFWDYIVEVFTLASSIASVFLVYLIYKWQKKDESEKEERQWKVEQFNNIFLSSRLDYLKSVFDCINIDIDNLENAYNDISQLFGINDQIGSKIDKLHKNFTWLIDSYDRKLSDQIKKVCDDFCSRLSLYVFDYNGRNSAPLFVDGARIICSEWQSNLLNVLLSYRGENQDRKKTIKDKLKILIPFIVIFLLLCIASFTIKRFDSSSQPNNAINVKIDSLQVDSQLKELRKLKVDTVYTKNASKKNKRRKRINRTKYIHVDCKQDTTEKYQHHIDMEITEK